MIHAHENQLKVQLCQHRYNKLTPCPQRARSLEEQEPSLARRNQYFATANAPRKDIRKQVHDTRKVSMSWKHKKIKKTLTIQKPAKYSGVAPIGTCES